MAMSLNEREYTPTTRQMTAIKVLYTFDGENKTNHLVRLPQVFPVQTFLVKESTKIGVIELPICLRAIIEASPELVASMSQDYSIYAYDYSENNNPLVGQGMLSKALAVGFSTSKPLSNYPKQLITGRIGTNNIDIFTNGAKETLEVRLRLVPVPITITRGHLEEVHKYRDSGTLCLTPDSNEWGPLIQANFAAFPQLDTPNDKMSHKFNGIGSEIISQLPSPQLPNQLSSYHTQPLSQNSDNGSRENETTSAKPKKASRLSSKISNKRHRGRKVKASMTRVVGNTSSYEEGTDDEDASAPKKKAKVQRSDWNTSLAFSNPPKSLRMVADTSSSLRLLRPVAEVPNSSTLIAGRQRDVIPVQVPASTISTRSKAVRNSQPKQGLRRNSNLSQMSSTSRMSSDKPEDVLQCSIESAPVSPIRNVSPFDTDTPPGMTSSPPVMKNRALTRMRSSPPCPSSPVLPLMPRTDSGFMSGSLEELFEESKEEVPTEDETSLPRKVQSRQNSLPPKSPTKLAQPKFVIEEECPGPMNLLPTKIPIFHQQARARSAVSFTGNVTEDGQSLPPLKKTNRVHMRRPTSRRQSSTLPTLESEEITPSCRHQTVSGTPVSNAWSRSQTTVRALSSTSDTLSTIPASDPVPPPSGRQRSQIWAGNMNAMDVNTSIIPAVAQFNSLQPPTAGPSLILSQSNSKKEMIRQRLEMAIANGETPPFCCNCGAIETPTWRKAWSKEMIGEPGYCEYSDEPGRVTAIIILTRDTEGKPTSYHLVKKYLGKDESQDDYNEYLLCNPCGIWMSKYKTARPEERWESNADRSNKGEPKKRPTQRVSKPKKAQCYAPPIPTSEANFLPSDLNPDQVEVSHPTNETSGRAPVSLTDKTSFQHSGMPEKKPPEIEIQDRNFEKMNPNSDAVSPIPHTEIRSSPTRWPGTQQSPINLEEDLGQTRRLLFPSPQKDSSPEILGGLTPNVDPSGNPNRVLMEVSAEALQKQDYSPLIADETDAEILRLFEEEFAKKTIKRTTTPVQESPTAHPFSTPSRQTPKHKSLTRSVSKSDRSIKSPGQLLVFSRTPGSSRKNSPNNHDGAFESPFSATLNQLISEANKNYSPCRNSNFDTLLSLPDGDSHLDLNTNYNLCDLFPLDIPHSPSNAHFDLFEETLDSIAELGWHNLDGVNASDLETCTDITIVKTEPEANGEQTLGIKEVLDKVSLDLEASKD